MSSSGKDGGKRLPELEPVSFEPGGMKLTKEGMEAHKRNQEKLSRLSEQERRQVLGLDKHTAAWKDLQKLLPPTPNARPSPEAMQKIKEMIEARRRAALAEAKEAKDPLLDQPEIEQAELSQPPPPAEPVEPTEVERRKRRVSQTDQDMRQIRPSVDLKLKRGLDPSSSAGPVQLGVTNQIQVIDLAERKGLRDPLQFDTLPDTPMGLTGAAKLQERRDRIRYFEMLRRQEESKAENDLFSGFGYMLEQPEIEDVLDADSDIPEDLKMGDGDPSDNRVSVNLIQQPDVPNRIPIDNPVVDINSEAKIPMDLIPVAGPDAPNRVAGFNLTVDPNQPARIPAPQPGDLIPPIQPPVQLPAQPPLVPPQPPPPPPPPPPPIGPFDQFNPNGLPAFLAAFMEMVRADGYVGPNPSNVPELTTILNSHATNVQKYRTFHIDTARALGKPDETIVETSARAQYVITAFKSSCNLAAKAEHTVTTGSRAIVPDGFNPMNVSMTNDQIDRFRQRMPFLAGLMEESRLAMPPGVVIDSMAENENRVLALIRVALRIYAAADFDAADPALMTENEVNRFIALMTNSIQAYNRMIEHLQALGVQLQPDAQMDGNAMFQLIIDNINTLRARIQLVADSYTSTRQIIVGQLPGVPDSLMQNWFQQENPQNAVTDYNNRLQAALQQRNGLLNVSQERLAALLAAFGVNVDPAAPNFDEVMLQAVQRYHNVIRLSPLASLVANVLERAGVNAQNIDEVKAALGPAIVNIIRAEELQRQLDEYRELRVLLDQTNIPISRLKNFMAKHGRDPESNLRKLLELSAERENVIAYGQFCAVMFRQLFVAMGAVISRVRDTHLELITNLQNFYAENRSVFVNQTVAATLDQLNAILRGSQGYELRYRNEGPNMFEFLGRGQLMARTPLFDRCESITRMCGAVILEMDPRANRNVRAIRGTLNDVWSMLDQFHMDWAERTVKLAESLVIPESASPARFTQTIDRTLGLLSTFTREGYELGGKLGEKASNGIESMRVSMINEMERLKTDINNRVGRVIIDYTRYLEYHQILQDDETINPDRGMDARIPLRQYFRHVNAFFMDLVANFNGQEAARELRSQQLLSQQMANQQTRLANATRDIRDLKNDKARLDNRLKEVFRVYTTLDNYSRDAVLYMSQRIAQATAGDVLDGKIYETLVNAYQQEIKGEPLNDDAMMGDRFDHRPPKVLEVAKALSGVLDLMLKRKDGCSKEVKQFLGAFGDAVKKYAEAANSFKQAAPGEDVEAIDTAMTVSVNDLNAAERVIKSIVAGFLQRVKAETAFITKFNQDSVDLVVRNETVSSQIREVIGEDIRAAGAGLIASDLKSAGVAHRTLVLRFMKVVAQAEKMLKESDKLEEKLLKETGKLEEKLGKAEAKIQMDKFKEALYKGLSRELGLNGRDGRDGRDGKEALANLVNNGLSLGPTDLATAMGGALAGKKAGKVDKSLLYIPGQNGNGRAGTAGWLGAALSMRRIEPHDKIKVMVAPRYMPNEGDARITCSYQQIYSFAQKVAGTADLPLNELLQPICPGMDVSSHEFKILLAHVDRLKEIHGDDYSKWWTEETKDVPMPPVQQTMSNGVPAIRGVPLVPKTDQFVGAVADNGEVKGDEEDGTESISSSNDTEESTKKKGRQMSERDKKQEEEEKATSETALDEDMSDGEAMNDFAEGERLRQEGRDAWLRTNRKNRRTLSNNLSKIPEGEEEEKKDERNKEREKDRDRDRLQTENRPKPASRRTRSDPEVNMEPLVSLNETTSTEETDGKSSDTDSPVTKSKKRTKDATERERERLVAEDIRRELAGEPPITGFRRRTYTVVKASSDLNERDKAHRAMVTELIDKILAAAGKPVSVEELDRLHRDVFNKQVRLFVEQTHKLETCTSGQMFEDLLSNYVNYNLCQLILTRVNMMRAKYADLTAHELMVAHGVTTEFANLMGTQLKRKESTRTSGYYSVMAREELQRDLNETTLVIDRLMKRKAPYDWVRQKLI